mgnify:FL=1
MNLIKCNNNHYYDADKFPACHYCSDMQSGFSQTMPANEQSDIGPTQPETEVTTTTTQNTVPPTVLDTDIQKTVGFYEEDMGLEPVVGWLVCIEGNLIGKDFRLTSGRNFIGRGSDMDVVLEGDPSVSRTAHAIVVYEPKENVYLIQPGASKELSYLNDSVVLESKVIAPNDVITVGATKLLFVPCCSKAFNWTDGKKTEKK